MYKINDVLPFNNFLTKTFEEKEIHNIYIKKSPKKLSEGMHGITYQVITKNGELNKYVLKVVPIIGYDELTSFNKEVQIGMLNNIGEVGPRIHASIVIGSSSWNTNNNERIKISISSQIKQQFVNYYLNLFDIKTKAVKLGVYIMDHFTFSVKNSVFNKSNAENVDFIKLWDYFGYGEWCSARDHKVLKILSHKLKRFYQITGGYHGDLHFDNIAVVVYKKTNTRNQNQVADVIIFDYGAHKKFRSKSVNSLQKFFNIIKKEHKENFNRLHNNYKRIGKNGILEVHPFNNEIYRANANVLGENFVAELIKHNKQNVRRSLRTKRKST